jgi:hypothetical protein
MVGVGDHNRLKTHVVKGRKTHANACWENQLENDHLEDPKENVRTILKRIFGYALYGRWKVLDEDRVRRRILVLRLSPSGFGTNVFVYPTNYPCVGQADILHTTGCFSHSMIFNCIH